jgi:xylulokinase
MHGAVLLDRDDYLLMPAVIWPDQRSGAQVAELTQALGHEGLIRTSGSPVATGFMAATLLWVRRKRPDLWAKLGTALLPKDWLRRRLTGEVACDPSDGSGALLLDVQARDWSPALLAAVGLERGQLPPLQPAVRVAGWLRQPAALQIGLPPGIPVVTGAADTACGVLGAGATRPDTLIVNLSTGGQLVLPAERPAVDVQGRIHTFCAALEPGPERAGWYQMGATLAAGMALRWLRDGVLGWTGGDAYDRMTAAAAAVPAGAEGLLFLPYLVGERTPHMDPQARGAFLGLTLRHGPGHLVRALLEGVTFACYDAYCVLAEVAAPPAQMILAGGGSRSPLWQQIVADVFGVPVRRLLVAEQSAVGAALLAGAGVGLLDPAEAAPRWAKYGEPVLSDAAAQERYAGMFPLFRQAYRANRELFAALAAQ